MKKLEMKTCKECYKLFMPTSNKQQYCSEPHYRPCPVCGKLVFAKYLSDPARCCSGVCKSKLGKLNKEKRTAHPEYLVPTSEVVAYAEADVKAVESAYAIHQALEGTVKKKYTVRTYDGWKLDHEYAVVIIHEGKEHIVKATYDYTAGEVVDLESRFTNKKKISTVFKAVR